MLAGDIHLWFTAMVLEPEFTGIGGVGEERRRRRRRRSRGGVKDEGGFV